ncbi:MAG: nuclear pore complex subunit [Bacteroidetes bacterium RIFCSPLOWO2_12_FULL_31_6]|nr:MAG: nuclear pore complex subunit [Bacteroidetes bacterium RIFCSPLOWO2_12_FULL_31_6]
MELINIEATDETPKVILNSETHVFEFSGKSLPEDVTQFYNPLLEWLETYKSSPGNSTKAIFKMDYFNTASSKLILDILMLLEEIHEETSGVSVEWHFKEDDEDMEEAGEEYSDIVDVPFKSISF